MQHLNSSFEEMHTGKCQASPTTAKKLEEKGYANVADFEAGLAGWEAAGYSFD